MVVPQGEEGQQRFSTQQPWVSPKFGWRPGLMRISWLVIQPEQLWKLPSMAVLVVPEGEQQLVQMQVLHAPREDPNRQRIV